MSGDEDLKVSQRASSAVSGVREPDHLRAFVRESNRIEGITRAPTRDEIDAHRQFLALATISVDDLCVFVLRVARRYLRSQPGMNVYVGNHRPPPGGPDIETTLEMVLTKAMAGVDAYTTHIRYETLHPFMDGNGRSGRVLWLWQMIRQHRDPYVLKRGFLHTFYYQTLNAIPQRPEALIASGQDDAAERQTEPRETAK